MTNTILALLSLFLLFPMNLHAQCLSGDCENGQGTFKMPDGGTYTGQFLNEMPSGLGKYITARGDIYEGEFLGGEFVTGHAKYLTKKGDRYEGEFKKGNMNGKGTLRIKNGEVYTGDFRDGDFNGQGLYTFPDGTSLSGEFRDGKLNGHGVYTMKEGVLDGQFKDGQPVEGTFKGKDKAVYEGQFQNGKFHGHGVVTLPDGTRFEGEFKDGSIVERK